MQSVPIVCPGSETLAVVDSFLPSIQVTTNRLNAMATVRNLLSIPQRNVAYRRRRSNYSEAVVSVLSASHADVSGFLSATDRSASRTRLVRRWVAIAQPTMFRSQRHRIC